MKHLCWMLFSAILATATLCHAATNDSPMKTSDSMKDLANSARVLLNEFMRDPSICLGPDGTYYLTGTTAGQDRIRIWKSTNLKDWEKLNFEWKYGDSPWHKKYKEKNMPIWAPEIHYLKNTFWLTYSMPSYEGFNANSGSGLLKSTTGKPEGPYVDVSPNRRLGDEIDASLFQDDDGTVYFLWHRGMIRKMKPDMSGPAEPGRRLKLSVPDANPKHHSGLCQKVFGPHSFDHIGFEGVFMFKTGDTYYLSGSDDCEGRYSCWIANSKTIYGPYSARYEAIPNGGHNVFFMDKAGKWWATIFNGPVHEKPGIIPVAIEPNGQISLRKEN
jgi:xylan 1,4-beta-xylosidase